VRLAYVDDSIIRTLWIDEAVHSSHVRIGASKIETIPGLLQRIFCLMSADDPADIQALIQDAATRIHPQIVGVWNLPQDSVQVLNGELFQREMFTVASGVFPERQAITTGIQLEAAFQAFVFFINLAKIVSDAAKLNRNIPFRYLVAYVADLTSILRELFYEQYEGSGSRASVFAIHVQSPSVPSSEPIDAVLSEFKASKNKDDIHTSVRVMTRPKDDADDASWNKVFDPLATLMQQRIVTGGNAPRSA